MQIRLIPSMHSALILSGIVMFIAGSPAAFAQIPSPHQPVSTMRDATMAVPAPADAARGVLSFADGVEGALSAVVRVVRLSADSAGQGRIQGAGSGAIVDAEKGYVVTNAHVVENGRDFRVDLADGRRAAAQLIGVDSATDIAVLKIALSDLTQINVADSDDLRVGDVAFAVGYPLGLEQTLTFGVVSGLGRQGVGEGLQDFIQTDAAINRGNSGGPLLDSRGRLIGINTAILSRTGGNIGIGFAVPSRIALSIAKQLQANGTVRRGTLGVSIADVDEEAARRLNLTKQRGALVQSVVPGSSAAAAGLQADDVITTFDGRAVRNGQSLRTSVGVQALGRPVELEYVRAGQTHKLRLTLKEQVSGSIASADGGHLGARLRRIKADDPFPQGAQGVFVMAVTDGSPAAQAGLAQGDLIVAANRQPVQTLDQLQQRLSVSPGPLQLLVARGNSLLPVVIAQ